MKIPISTEFEKDFISREAGERLRNQILASFNKGENIVLDFSGIIVASTSFFDEAIAKLAEEGWDMAQLKKWVTFQGLNPRDKNLLEGLCIRRGLR